MTRRPPLRLEELGARVLPSVTPLAVAPERPAALAAHRPAAHHPLSGKGHGTYSTDAVQSGVGIEYHLHGTAKLAGVGQVTVRGSVHSVGFIREGHAGGTLTFRNTHGSVTVSIEGPLQAGFAALPRHFKYHIVKGTGDYAHLKDTGSLTLVLKAGADPQHGTFKLSI